MGGKERKVRKCKERGDTKWETEIATTCTAYNRCIVHTLDLTVLTTDTALI